MLGQIEDGDCYVCGRFFNARKLNPAKLEREMRVVVLCDTCLHTKTGKHLSGPPQAHDRSTCPMCSVHKPKDFDTPS